MLQINQPQKIQLTEQLVDFNKNLDVTSASSQVTKKKKKKERRAYESTGMNIEPYRMQPKLQISDLFPKTDKR